MDLAVDVVSAMDEVYLNNPEVGKRALIMSGIRVGRAGIGTQTQLFFLLTFFIFGALYSIYGTVHTHNEYTSQQGDSFSHCRDRSRMHRPCGRGSAIGTGSRYLYCQERFICPLMNPRPFQTYIWQQSYGLS